MLVELNQLLELDPVEIVEEQCLLWSIFLGFSAHLLDDRLRMNLLLDVDWHRRDFERLLILLILALPNQLRVERRIAGIEQTREFNGLRALLIVSHEVPQLFGGNIRALVFVLDGFNFFG